MNIKKIVLTIKLYLAKDGIERATILRNSGIFHLLGENVYYHSRKIPSEPYMVSIHNNVSIAANITFITHDVMSSMLSRIPKYKEDNNIHFIPWMDKIEIFNNVAIGANTTIMYGVTIESNCIVAAGSTVTKSVPSGEIWGGCPAKKIGTIDAFVAKRFLNLDSKRPTVRSPRDIAEKYFWND